MLNQAKNKANIADVLNYVSLYALIVCKINWRSMKNLTTSLIKSKRARCKALPDPVAYDCTVVLYLYVNGSLAKTV